ncbi:MAG TPA: ATP-binding protein [Candidatus Bathyarchaeia archaeon]|jgi:PAS domain S-box-containing protein|nr:ATP-binding protein [Candidatus Bathyarchaeia archaeon]
MRDPLAIFVPANRRKWLVTAGVFGAAIALLEWWTEPYISLGFLYLFPIMIAGGFLSRQEIVIVALLCAGLDFSNLPKNEHERFVHLIFSSAGFMGTGLFISELGRNRRLALERHADELADQVKRRQEAEERLDVLVESSSAAIVTIGSDGKILLYNEAAQRLMAPEAPPLRGQSISAYLPALQRAVETPSSTVFRTTMQCTGQRYNGERFLAGVWFSTYGTVSGPRLAAIIVDLSEDLRSREDLSLNYLLKNSRILMSATAHEVRNLCGAVLVVYNNLSRVKQLQGKEDFQALGTLIQSLQGVSALEVQAAPGQSAAAVELKTVLDEFRVLIENACRESGIQTVWQIAEPLPLVWADRYGLVQVLLNLAKNSQHAMLATETKRLCVKASEEDRRIVVRFEDAGVGISSPENLFRPFQSGADVGRLGLYVSRAIMRSFGGELAYEARPAGCCFAVSVPVLCAAKESVNS